jgi:FtsZ-interacting cell division protein YlmF
MEHKRKKSYDESRKTKSNKHINLVVDTEFETNKKKLEKLKAVNKVSSNKVTTENADTSEKVTIHTFVPHLYKLLDELEESVKEEPNSVITIDLNEIKSNSVKSIEDSLKSIIQAKNESIERARSQALVVYKKDLTERLGISPNMCCIEYCENAEPMVVIQKLVCKHFICTPCYNGLRKVGYDRHRKQSIVVTCPICREKSYDRITQEPTTENRVVTRRRTNNSYAEPFEIDGFVVEDDYFE